MRRVRIPMVAAAVAGLMLGGSASTVGRARDSFQTAAAVRSEAAAARSQAIDLLFNLDYGDALAKCERAIAIDPTDPIAQRLAASVIWMRILFERGAILVADYLGQARSGVERTPPSASADRDFHAHISRAIELAEQQLKSRPQDPEAHYQVGAAYGFLASYIATVEGRVMGAMGSARHAYSEHQRVLELDRGRQDAAMIVGTYQFSISQLSFPKRWFAYFAGFDADRARGLKLVEAAAAYPSDSQTDALFILILLSTHEGRFDEARRSIETLQQRYPRNRLLWLEAATVALRAGRLDEARASLEHGLAMLAVDNRPRAPGEEARWHLSYGMVLVRRRQLGQADGELRLALAATAPLWVQGRVQVEFGKIADLSGDRSRAIEIYRRAVALSRAAHDDAAVDEANRLIKKAYAAGSGF